MNTIDFDDLFVLDPVRRDGDFAPLIGRLRSGEELTPRMREFIADILEGKWKRPRHRVRKNSIERRDIHIAYFILMELDNDKNKNLKRAKGLAVEKFGLRPRSIESAWTKYRTIARGFVESEF